MVAPENNRKISEDGGRGGGEKEERRGRAVALAGRPCFDQSMSGTKTTGLGVELPAIFIIHVTPVAGGDAEGELVVQLRIFPNARFVLHSISRS